MLYKFLYQNGWVILGLWQKDVIFNILSQFSLSALICLKLVSTKTLCIFSRVTNHDASFVFLFVTIGSCINSILGPFILSFMGSRGMMVTSALGSAICWATTSQLGNLFYVQVIMGLINSFFFNMHFYASNIVFQGWMNKKRIFGNGVVFCGVPLGGLILAPFWTHLFTLFNWKGWV